MDERTIIVKKGSVSSFLTGALFGAAIALLFAPHSGTETRSMLSERGVEIKDKAVNVAQNTRERAAETINTAANKLNETVKSVKQGVQNTGEEKQLKRELEIMDDVNNPYHPL